jgi:prepilin-type processing-associated H-X9-DG protein
MSDPIAYWNGPAAERWVSEQDDLDNMVRPFGDAALGAARVTAGESVLDVGCGCGETLLSLASLVGPTGRVVGVDASLPMLARAKDRCSGRMNVAFLDGDATKVIPSDPHDASFDVALSRCGVLVFADPVAAFRRIRGALRPGGRLSFVCWRAVEENPWAAVPFAAVAKVLGPPEPAAPDAPGPFSFGSAARVRAVLESAGFRDVTTEKVDHEVGYGTTTDLDATAAAVARVGPVARMLVDRDEATRARAIAAVRDVLPPYVQPGGAVRFPASAWVVTARNV